MARLEERVPVLLAPVADSVHLLHLLLIRLAAPALRLALLQVHLVLQSLRQVHLELLLVCFQGIQFSRAYPHAGTPEVTAPVTTGSSNPPYAATAEKDPSPPNNTLQYQTISCMPAYRGTSPEVRLPVVIDFIGLIFLRNCVFKTMHKVVKQLRLEVLLADPLSPLRQQIHLLLVERQPPLPQHLVLHLQPVRLVEQPHLVRRLLNNQQPQHSELQTPKVPLVLLQPNRLVPLGALLLVLLDNQPRPAPLAEPVPSLQNRPQAPLGLEEHSALHLRPLRSASRNSSHNKLEIRLERRRLSPRMHSELQVPLERTTLPLKAFLVSPAAHKHLALV